MIVVLAVALAGAIGGAVGTAQAEGSRSSSDRQLLFYNHSYGVFDRETADAIEHSDYLREFANFQVRTTTGTGGQTWTGRYLMGRETYLELFGVGDIAGQDGTLRQDFQSVAVRIVEVDAPAAVVVVDLAGAVVEGVRPVREARLPDPGEDRVEVVLGDEERVVLRRDLAGRVHVVEGHAVGDLDRDEGAVPGLTLRPRMSARKRAEACLSRAVTMVWFS